MLQRIIGRFQPQVRELILSVEQDKSRYETFALPMFSDLEVGPHGPLMGLASAFQFTQAKTDIALCPCDAPFVPANLVSILAEKMEAEGADIVCPSYQGELQPTFALWNKRTAERVIEAATKEQIGGLRALYSEFSVIKLDWPQAECNQEYNQKLNPFFNINTPEELNFALSL